MSPVVAIACQRQFVEPPTISSLCCAGALLPPQVSVNFDTVTDTTNAYRQVAINGLSFQYTNTPNNPAFAANAYADPGPLAVSVPNYLRVCSLDSTQPTAPVRILTATGTAAEPVGREQQRRQRQPDL